MKILLSLLIFADISSSALPKVSFTSSFSSILKLVFGLVGVLSTVFVAWGGLKYTLASGDPSQIKQAKETVLYAVIGLIVSISAFTIVSFVLGKAG
jgi:hypothetical protein